MTWGFWGHDWEIAQLIPSGLLVMGRDGTTCGHQSRISNMLPIGVPRILTCELSVQTVCLSVCICTGICLSIYLYLYIILFCLILSYLQAIFLFIYMSFSYAYVYIYNLYISIWSIFTYIIYIDMSANSKWTFETTGLLRSRPSFQDGSTRRGRPFDRWRLALVVLWRWYEISMTFKQIRV